MISWESILNLAKQIQENCLPEKIILFGSYAYASPSKSSDVDVLVILPFEGTNFRKSLEIYKKINVNFPVDILARKPEDTAKRYKLGDPLIQVALEKGKILYERTC